MKEFTSAVEDVVAEAEHEAAVAEREVKINRLIEDSRNAREAFIAAAVEEGKTKKAATAAAPKVLTREEAEEQVPEVAVEETPIEFLLDGRTMHAFMPTDGQLAFMLSGLGRGQTQDQRFASIINVMLSSFRDDDRDHFENRLLSRGPDRLGVKKIEEVFEYLTEEWFARPTQP